MSWSGFKKQLSEYYEKVSKHVKKHSTYYIVGAVIVLGLVGLIVYKYWYTASVQVDNRNFAAKLLFKK